MPQILTDPGKPDTVPVQFEDGPMLGNDTFTINPNRVDLREEVIARHQGNDHFYKVVEIGDVLVLLDFLRTE